jgi:hypothetical protein
MNGARGIPIAGYVTIVREPASIKLHRPRRLAYDLPSAQRRGELLQAMAAGRRTAGYEHVTQPVARFPDYLRRQLRSIGIGVGFIAVALYAGMLGYHYLVGLSWIDSYENAAMILSGMGPLAAPATTAGKLFAGSYALFSGIAVLAIAGIIAAPLVHRFLHRMHADPGEDN